ncbi:DUF3883 domain-containing protein [Lactobacillus panisapium]|uniref:DUF3883 domain-containing protein n=1 Tax=Lactobacillus panisapium TaxID=2012495 RepID=UPI001C698084|nr:DUF3883 domain-containing protein [Lactobacillus panisapium]QYN58286.1 DUF3883 domain-containing protein [Lactobacillus panisapium]
MATSESEIRIGVSILLNKYGSLNTSEVKKKLNTVINFDRDDLKVSSTRPDEPKIMQRIGNIVSHQKEKKQNYLDTYQIDKTKEPAQWTLLTGLKSTNTLKPISNNDIKTKKKLKNKFDSRKIDWEKANDKKSKLGSEGEDFIIKYEKKRVSNFAPNDTDRIFHLSEEVGDGAGYDIISLEDDGRNRYIEVKTTKGGLKVPFYMSQNEKDYFDLHKHDDNLYVYRVYDFDTNNKSGKVKKIPAIKVADFYDFTPVSYKVSKK